jgi:hypothetical protein
MPEDIHWQKYASRFQTLSTQLQVEPNPAEMVVAIPVYAEPDLMTTLGSLLHCDLPDAHVDVLLLFNSSIRMTKEEIKQHENSWKETLEWIHHHQKQGLTFLPIYIKSIPDPKGGVGWARKLVMDEAARRLGQQGVILCLDADCTVEKNYLRVVYDYFKSHEQCDAASIYFEHQLDHLEGRKRDAIVQYELHLRYLVHALRWAGHPFAYYTVGSSMAVRRRAYLAQGGMNTRQAGEDFYFLQKFIEIGRLHDIKSTTVYPSARLSSRVPFGTGRAMLKMSSEESDWKTTSLKIYAELKTLLDKLNLFRSFVNEMDEDLFHQRLQSDLGISSALSDYLRTLGFFLKCREISTHTASDAAFKKRFFRYFNAFWVIRYAHDMRDLYYSDVSVVNAAMALAYELNKSLPVTAMAEDYLDVYRLADRQ